MIWCWLFVAVINRFCNRMEVDKCPRMLWSLEKSIMRKPSINSFLPTSFSPAQSHFMRPKRGDDYA